MTENRNCTGICDACVHGHRRRCQRPRGRNYINGTMCSCPCQEIDFPAWKEQKRLDMAGRGFTLIEMVIVMTILVVLMAISVPNVVTLAHNLAQSDARKVEKQEWLNISAWQVCLLQNQQQQQLCAGVQALVPASQFQEGAYTYTLQMQNGSSWSGWTNWQGEPWTFTGTPNQQGLQFIQITNTRALSCGLQLNRMSPC